MSKNLAIEISDDDANYSPPVIEQSQADVARVDIQHLRVRIADTAYRINASFEFRYNSDSEWQLVVRDEWEMQKFEIIDWDDWSEVDDIVAYPVRAMVRAFFVPDVDVDQLAELRAAAIDAQLADHRSAIEVLESSKRR